MLTCHLPTVASDQNTSGKFLHYRRGLEHASLPVILSLIDQLEDARHHLRKLTRAVAGQRDAVQQDITRLMIDAASLESE